MGNDPVRTRLFISTLKGVAFEWFRKLPKGSITCWDDLEALFLSRFFEEVADINMHTLLLTKQKEGELVKDFIERFCELAMRSRSGMTPETLVETCRHNFLTPILVQMGGCRVHDLEATPRAWLDCTRAGCPRQSQGEEQ